MRSIRSIAARERVHLYVSRLASRDGDHRNSLPGYPAMQTLPVKTNTFPLLLVGKPPARANARPQVKTYSWKHLQLQTAWKPNFQPMLKWMINGGFLPFFKNHDLIHPTQVFWSKNASASWLPCSCKHCCKLKKWHCRNPGNGPSEAAQVVSTWQLSQIYVAWRGISVYFVGGTKKSWRNGCIIF